MKQGSILDNMYGFVYRGILSQNKLDSIGHGKKSVDLGFLDDEIASRIPFDQMEFELLSAARRMSTVYAAVCTFENSVRRLVVDMLIEHHKENWWNKGVSESIRKTATSRMEKESKTKWHTRRGEDPINYTEFGDLLKIIVSNWTLFEPLLQTRDWVRSILQPLEMSRHVLMHGGELDMRDVERVGMLMRDWFAQVVN